MKKYQIQEEMSGEMGLWVVVIVILTCVLSEGNLLGDHIFSFAITSIWNELSRNGSYYGKTQNIYHNHHFLSPPLTNRSSLPVVMFLKSDHFDFRSYMRKITRIFFTIRFFLSWQVALLSFFLKWMINQGVMGFRMKSMNLQLVKWC